MRLVSFESETGAGYGVVKGDGVVDLTRRLGTDAPDLRALLAADGLPRAALAAAEATADLALDDLRYLPPIPAGNKVICIGLNYADHAEEAGLERPEKPMIFARWPDAQTGHGQPLLRPRESDRFDFEAELAVVIGRGGRRIPAARAMEAVAGYTAFNDGSLRDWQFHTSQFGPGKNFPASGSMGPWLVTADDIEDPGKLSVAARLNGKTMQDGTTADLIFPIPELIAYISIVTPLGPGDVIATGTPAGVGFSRKPPVFMKPGDTIEVEIEGIGVLRNPVAEG